MTDRSNPNFAEILGPAITSVPDPARPALLAMLERGAADRYRQWAASEPAHAAELEACAAREDQIADRIDQLLPMDPAHEKAVLEAVPVARSAYFAVFEGLPIAEQWRLQSLAERQGAAAWRLLASQQGDPSVREALEGCSQLEEASASVLEKLIS